MDADEAAAVIAARDQSKAAMEDLAEHIGAFYSRLTHSMSESHALELTQTFLIESLDAEDDD